MTQDAPYRGNSDDRPEWHLRVGGPGAGAAGSRTEPAEPRTRTEYYEALRAADGEAVRAEDASLGRGRGPQADPLRAAALSVSGVTHMRMALTVGCQSGPATAGRAPGMHNQALAGEDSANIYIS